MPCEATESGWALAVTVTVCGAEVTVKVTSALPEAGGEPVLVAVAVSVTTTDLARGISRGRIGRRGHRGRGREASARAVIAPRPGDVIAQRVRRRRVEARAPVRGHCQRVRARGHRHRMRHRGHRQRRASAGLKRGRSIAGRRRGQRDHEVAPGEIRRRGVARAPPPKRRARSSRRPAVAPRPRGDPVPAGIDGRRA